MKYDVHITTPGSNRYEYAIAFAYESYVATHNATIVVRPEILAVATRDERILGTMGLILDHEAPHFFEQCDPPGAFERFAPHAERTMLAEVSRFAITPTLSPREARAVAETLSAHLFAYGYEHGIRHFGFVGKEKFRSFLSPLGITLIQLGKPLFNNVSPELVGRYASQKSLFCFGFTLTNLKQFPQRMPAPQAD